MGLATRGRAGLCALFLGSATALASAAPAAAALAPPTITQGPQGLTNQNPTYSWTLPDGATSAVCRFDDQPFKPCTPGGSNPRPTDGPHTFEVKALDAQGNESPPASRSFTYDSKSPVVHITTPAKNGDPLRSDAVVEFTSDEPTICRFDGYGFGPCTSPLRIPSTGARIHTVIVRGTDAAGNVEQVVRTFRLVTAGTVPADGGTVDSGERPTSDPFETAVSVPAGVGGGTITIDEKPTRTTTLASGVALFGQQPEITSTAATSAAKPLSIAFTIDSSALAEAGVTRDTVDVYRDGVVAGACSGAVAEPDPCVKERVTRPDGDAVITVLSSRAGVWNFGRGELPDPPPAPDRQGPLLATTLKAKQNLRTVLDRGLKIPITCDEARTVTAKLFLDAKTAAKLKLPQQIGSARATGTSRRETVTVKLTAKAKKRLKKVRSVKATLTLEAVDYAGNRTTLPPRKLTLKR